MTMTGSEKEKGKKEKQTKQTRQPKERASSGKVPEFPWDCSVACKLYPRARETERLQRRSLPQFRDCECVLEQRHTHTHTCTHTLAQ